MTNYTFFKCKTSATSNTQLNGDYLSPYAIVYPTHELNSHSEYFLQLTLSFNEQGISVDT